MTASGRNTIRSSLLLMWLAACVLGNPSHTLAQDARGETHHNVAAEYGSNAEIPLYEALLIPGRAQFRAGQRGKGSLLTTVAFISVLSFGGSQWLYARQTEQAASLERQYMADIETLYPLADYADADGYVTNWSVYRDWENAYDDARKMRTYRMYALMGVGVVYLVNAVDVYFGKRSNNRLTPMISCRLEAETCMIGGRLEF